MTAPRTLRIIFLHPDLGLGGAERLVVDAALAAQSAGHSVSIYTPHHDPAHAFEETFDGTLDVRVRGSRFPRHVADRFLAPATIVRTRLAAARLVREEAAADIVFCDGVPHAMTALVGLRARRVYYCHFPDKLLAPAGGRWRALYRTPIDRLEERATGLADLLLANSRYTVDAFRRAFPSLSARAIEVLNPAIDVCRYQGLPAIAEPAGELPLVSINRFEARKNLDLALDAFVALKAALHRALAVRLRLVLAGGYDERLIDNRTTLDRLTRRIAELGVGAAVRIELSVSETRKLELLAAARCVLYTPAGEHFGYGPVEAMAAGRPVVVADSGGPAETVLHGETGFVVAPEAGAFSAAARLVLEDADLAGRMGAAGRRRVAERYSRSTFDARLVELFEGLARR